MRTGNTGAKKRSTCGLIEDEIASMLKDDIEPMPDLSFEKLKAAVYPEISKKVYEMERESSRKKEIAVVKLAYAVFSIVAAVLIWNIVTGGVNHIVRLAIMFFGTASALLLCFIPLFIKFKSNINKRGVNKYEI